MISKDLLSKALKLPKKTSNSTSIVSMAIDGGLKGNRAFTTSLIVESGLEPILSRLVRMVRHKIAVEKCTSSSVDKVSPNSELLHLIQVKLDDNLDNLSR